MTARPQLPVFMSLPPMMSGMSTFSPAICFRRLLIDARSDEPAAYERTGSLSGGGTRRWPLNAEIGAGIANQCIAEGLEVRRPRSEELPPHILRFLSHDLVESPQQLFALRIW